MAIGYLQYIDKTSNTTDIKYETIKSLEDNGYNLELKDILSLPNDTLVISQAGDYFKIINNEAISLDSEVEIKLTQYWLTVRFKEISYKEVTYMDILQIISEGREYINIMHTYNGEVLDGSLDEILINLSRKYKDSFLCHALLNGKWKIQY